MRIIKFTLSLLLLSMNTYAQTQTRNNAGLMGNEGANSGFFETSNPINYPSGATSWWHLLDVRHSNTENNYAMQFSGSFYDQQLFFRKTNHNAAQSWSRVLLETDGKVGIGRVNPISPLHVYGGASMSSGWNRTSTLEAMYPVQVFNSNSSKFGGIGYDFTSGMVFWVNAGNDDVSGTGTLGFSIRNDGNIYMGSNLSHYNTNYKLNVGGKIRANELIVNTTGADFVFQDGYDLQTLLDLEKFIKKNKHLPEIPTAKEMQVEGVQVGLLQKKLLQKVEELTLYLIEQNKRLLASETIQEELRDEIKNLKFQRQGRKLKLAQEFVKH